MIESNHDSEMDLNSVKFVIAFDILKQSELFNPSLSSFLDSTDWLRP